MLRNPSWTVIPASVAALVALFVPQASQADTCLSAPTGAAPNGQHWYYHLDRATRKKCWYLHETIAPSAAKASARTRPDSSTPLAAPERATSARPQGDRSAQASGAAGAPAPAEAKPAPPLQATSDPAAAQRAATVWPDSAPASDNLRDASDTPSGDAPAATWRSTDTQPNAIDEAAVQGDTKPVSAAFNSPNSVALDLFIVGLAAVLAGAVSAGFALLRRRKPRKGKAAHLIAAALTGTMSAKVAAFRRRPLGIVKPAYFTSRLGVKPDRQEIGQLRSRIREDDSAPIQPSLIPEQITMVRPFAPPSVRGHNTGDRRVHID